MIWADGRDVLEGEAEHDTGMIAHCATPDQANEIAAYLNGTMLKSHNEVKLDIELAHRELDAIGVPRINDGGRPLTVYGRLSEYRTRLPRIR